MEIKKPIVLDQLSDNTVELKKLLTRLNKGVGYIDRTLGNGNVVDSAKAARLFRDIAEETTKLIEDSLFIHEFLTTGATVLVTRQGKPVKAESVIGDNLHDYTFVNAFTVSSVEKLKEVFGEDYIKFIEIVN